MLYGGVALLLVGVGLLIFCVLQKRPYKALFAIFPLAIVMIGFPAFTHLKLPGGVEVDLTNNVTAFAKAPFSPAARSNANQALDALLFTNQSRSLPPDARTNLALALDELHKAPVLTPESRVTMAKLQLALGHTNQAATNLQLALRANTNLIVSPALKRLTAIR